MKSLRSRYVALFGEEGTTPDELARIEASLGVALPAEFREVALFSSGGVVGGLSLNEVSTASDENIVSETLRIRKAVPIHSGYVVLADLSESLILMNCCGGAQDGMVVWCDAADVLRLERPLLHDLTVFEAVWPDFSLFFDFLLTEEEASR